jgi:glycosyltransferase involved in cell wall biosynthesis
MSRLLIFDTHPIPYRSPIFRALSEISSVYYFDEQFDGKKWWFHEVGKIPEQIWELPLRYGFKSDVLNTHSLNLLQTFAALKKAIVDHQPRGVVIFGYYLPEHWMLWWLCHELRIPLIFVGETFQTGGTFFRRSLKSLLRPVFFRGVNKFLAIGTKTHEFYRSAGIEPDRIVDAKYCVDTDFFASDSEPKKIARTKIRTSLGIADDAFVILFVGRLFERKRPRDLFTLEEEIDDDNFYTVMVGNGPLEGPLKDLAQRRPRIRLVGFKNQTEMRDFYSAADCLVVPSTYETWGLVINEALASGIPAVVTDTCGAAHDLIIDGETGFIFPVGDFKAAARAIKKIATDPLLRARLSKNGTRISCTNYGIEQFANALSGALD